MAGHQPGRVPKDQAHRQVDDDREDQERGEGGHWPATCDIDELSKCFDRVGSRRPQQCSDRTECQQHPQEPRRP